MKCKLIERKLEIDRVYGLAEDRKREEFIHSCRGLCQWSLNELMIFLLRLDCFPKGMSYNEHVVDAYVAKIKGNIHGKKP